MGIFSPYPEETPEELHDQHAKYALDLWVDLVKALYHPCVLEQSQI